jgi:hypothetical protein
MTKTQNIAACVGLTLACAIAFRSAFWISGKTAPVTAEQPAPMLDQNNIKPVEAANQTTTAASPTPVAQPMKSPPVIAENDAGTGGDGKEVLPVDGKETLPPVGMLLPSRPFAVSTASGDPGIEFLNKNKSSSNQLLDPPNPQNVDGPVVSPETR